MTWFLVILLALFLFWPWISKWLSRQLRSYMSRRAEDMMRRMMGMPPRRKERKKRPSRAADSRRNGRRESRTKTAHVSGAAEMMEKVAVDVEFTEIKEYSRNERYDGATGKTVVEEQVTDAEFVEIKTPVDNGTDAN